MLMEHATLKEVARLARVSTSTVSRILNGKFHHRSQTVLKVEKAVEKLRYSQKSKRSAKPVPDCIGLVSYAFPGFLGSTYSGTLMTSIVETLTAENFSLHLIALTSNRLNIEYIENEIDAYNLRGLIVLEFDILYAISQELEELPIPVIGVGNLTGISLHRNVCSNNYLAGCDAANFLWSNGHRKIGVVTMAQTDFCQKLRLSGFSDTLLKLGADSSDIRIKELYSTTDSISGWISELVNSKERPTAVFCHNSGICQKLYAGLIQAKVRVPEDISLLSLEENGELKYLATPISVLAQPTRQMGETAVRMLLKCLNGIDVRAQETLNCSLIIRKSVRTVPVMQS